MTDFRSDLNKFSAKLQARQQALFINVASAAKLSITDGSPLTGAPGQPVGQYGPGYHPGKTGGELKASWQLTFDSPTHATIATNEPYAPQNEYGISGTGGPYTQRSSVGGRFSVTQTAANINNIVNDELQKLSGGAS